MPRGWESIFDPAKHYSNDDYSTWAYGVRWTEYDKGFLSSCMIAAR